MNTFPYSMPAKFDPKSVSDTIERALASAGLDINAGPMRDLTSTIRAALARGKEAAPTGPAPGPDTSVIDVMARVVNPLEPQRARPSGRPAAPDAPGEFLERQYAGAAGSRMFKIYVPSKRPAAPMPVVLMLHGCTQSADDFALGTKMNHLAEENGFLVVYPEQPSSANMSKCWNWFKGQDQHRNAGEPSLIAGILNEVADQYSVDRRRVFVAGLSAGAAMAVIMGETYPELFAAVGVHSGLPYKSAQDIPSAMAAMKGGRSGMPDLKGLAGQSAPACLQHAVPTIIFHGDRDHTVQRSNGEVIAQQAGRALAVELGKVDVETTTRRGQAPGGRSYTQTVHHDSNGVPKLESWTVHGAGHAWAGGSAMGSYTDASGPDASAEMVRFFLAQTRAGSA